MMTETTTYTGNELLQMLHKAGVRPSAQRLAVLDYIANRKTHPAADEVYVHLSHEFPSMSRTTVYNSLHALAEAGVLRPLEIESQSTRYDLAPHMPHSHFRCTACGRIFDMALPPGIESAVTQGFRVATTELCFAGTCPECTARGNAN